MSDELYAHLAVLAIVATAVCGLAIYLLTLAYLPGTPGEPPAHRVERVCWVDFAGDRICE